MFILNKSTILKQIHSITSSHKYFNSIILVLIIIYSTLVFMNCEESSQKNCIIKDDCIVDEKGEDDCIDKQSGCSKVGKKQSNFLDRNQIKKLSKTPSNNSSLKKKQMFINKIKYLHLEDSIEIMNFLEVENMKRFYLEIINSVVFNAKRDWVTVKEIQLLLKIIYLYSFDATFILKTREILKSQMHRHFSIWLLFLGMNLISTTFTSHKKELFVNNMESTENYLVILIK